MRCVTIDSDDWERFLPRPLIERFGHVGFHLYGKWRYSAFSAMSTTEPVLMSDYAFDSEAEAMTAGVEAIRLSARLVAEAKDLARKDDAARQ